MFFKFRKPGLSLYSFCKTIEKTSIQLFVECHITNQLRIQLKCSCKDEFNFPPLTHTSAIFGVTNLTNKVSLMKHLLLISKLHVYSTREKIHVNIIQLNSVINNIIDAKLKMLKRK